MAYFLRLPRVDRSARIKAPNLSRYTRPDGRTIFVTPAPLVAHDRCVPEGFENHSTALAAEWQAVKAEVREDNRRRGDVSSRTGEPFEGPSADTPRELVERLNAAGRAVNAWRDPISTLAGPGWDWCWSPLYSLEPDAPPCHWCGEPCTGRG